MDRDDLLAQLLKNPRLKEFVSGLKEGASFFAEGLWDCPKAVLATLAQEATKKPILILTGGESENRLFDDLAYFSKQMPLELPAWETLPSERVPPSPDVVGERMKALYELLTRKKPSILFCPLQSCMQKLFPQEIFLNRCTVLKVGQTYPFEKLQDFLLTLGFDKKHLSSDKGEFAVRGNIIDIYPVSSPEPFRLECFDDCIESIRTFDPASQKSIQKVKETSLITPALEMEPLLKGKNSVTLFDYWDEPLIIFDDLLALEDRFVALKSMLTKPGPAFLSFDDLFKKIASFQKVFCTKERLEELSDRAQKPSKKNVYSQKAPPQPFTFSVFNQDITALRWNPPFITLPAFLHPEELAAEEFSGEELLTALSDQEDLDLHFFAATVAEKEHWQKEIAEKGIALPKKTTTHMHYLSSGFGLQEPTMALFPFTEITHRYRLRRTKMRASYQVPSTELLDLKKGDLVVHFNHGVAKFLGIEKRPNNTGQESEFLSLEYAEGAKLFVPIGQSFLLTKYMAPHEEIPKLHTLGSNRWKKLRSSAEQALMGYATKLLELYAKRKYKERRPYGIDSDDVVKFAAEFPFEPTHDQLQTIADIKSDMQSDKLMDRLVCGDVGYGKTEVAMRAAFKVVVDGHAQVAMLVPTTVLAMQHYESFCERMANFPVRIKCLSRFCKPKEIKKTLEEIAEGKVDIVIGTHRLLSKDVHFCKLGLIIVDEEQRFGVRAKEHLKTLKEEADCLTLSATPIPRTLYMSLVGARDMSIIATPPQDRLPIKTIVADSVDEVIHQALLRELARDGQVFAIHNRIETIYTFGDRIKKLLPGARLLIAHGQMSADEIDATFHAFKMGRADILLATTIVENGIDIPNANTILIDRADQYGLADLYQLRGRVGRWNRRAYAYFLLSPRRLLSEIAKKRIEALSSTSGKGGGMRIAMRDLEIRGGGDILGIEQSGHVATIGFHLYCKLLKRTIDALQGKGTLFLFETRIDFPQEARLPEEYINATGLRMEFYQRLGDAQTEEEVDALFSELKDRFGTPPLPVIWLYHLTRLRVFAARNQILTLKLNRFSLSIEIKAKGKIIPYAMPFCAPTDPKQCELKIIQTLKKELKL